MKTELKDALALLRKIKFSKDYEKFKFLDNNRILTPGHTQTMIESIRAMGVIRPVVCIETDVISGKKERYVTDGQHMFTGLVAEGLEIPYIVLNVEDEIELVVKMAKMNNSSKSWTLINYVNAFKPYLPDYQKLFKMRNLYNIEPLMLAAICTRGTSAVVAGSQLIKSGNFKITNKESQEMAKAFNDFFLKIGRADRWVKHQFLQVFMRAWGTYDHEISLKNLDKHIKTIKAMSDTGAAESFISKNIFNLTK
jgi:disulfide oxidoreductase YuzD